MSRSTSPRPHASPVARLRAARRRSGAARSTMTFASPIASGCTTELKIIADHFTP